MTIHNAVPDDAHRARMQRRKEIQDQRVGNASHEKGLVIVHTGSGKGKTTAAFGMALRTLGHGRRVAIIQFIKGTRDTGERRAFAHWGEQLRFHAVGEGFTWETQDHARDVAAALHGWGVALRYLADPDFQLVVLDEVNVALRLGHLTLAGAGRHRPAADADPCRADRAGRPRRTHRTRRPCQRNETGEAPVQKPGRACAAWHRVLMLALVKARCRTAARGAAQ